MKPGPATSTFVDVGIARAAPRRCASASSRGFLPAALASTMAALVARSPWRGIARRLDHDARKVEPGGSMPAGDQRLDGLARRDR